MSGSPPFSGREAVITTPEEVPPMLTRVLALMVIFPEAKGIRRGGECS